MIYYLINYYNLNTRTTKISVCSIDLSAEPPLVTTMNDVGIIFAGNGFYTNQQCYHYIETPLALQPTIMSLNPDFGLTLENNVVTIIGNNLSDVTSINFGDVVITSFNIINNNTISVLVPLLQH